MSKIRFAPFLFLPVLFSCQKELSFNTPLSPADSASLGSSFNCKACAYLPNCDKSTLTYQMSAYGQVTTTTKTIAIIKDTAIDGSTFQKTGTAGVPGYSYYNCNGNTVTLVVYNATSLQGYTVPKMELIYLKSDLPVGGTWTNTLTNSSGQTVLYTYTIAEKSIAHTVLGVNYPDVIHVSDSITIGGTEVMTEDTYYAKGVGIIDYSTSMMGTVLLTELLKSYSIP